MVVIGADILLRGRTPDWVQTQDVEKIETRLFEKAAGNEMQMTKSISRQQQQNS